MTAAKTLALLAALWVAVPAGGAHAAPKADLWARWEAHRPGSAQRVDHSAWDRLLRKHVVVDHPSGVNRVPYPELGPTDRAGLDAYLEALQATSVSDLDRPEQRAYWINLYNALTVKVILDRYPVKSIRDVDISPGWFSDGPWGAKLLLIEGEEVSLDDIEHRILRPLWKDPRLHYAVNCASLGCPNLQPQAFTAENAEALLDRGAREYVNHPRGAHLDGDRLVLSSLYTWFREDFGGSEEGVLAHLRAYAEPPLARVLAGFKGKLRYEYDWALNE